MPSQYDKTMCCYMIKIHDETGERYVFNRRTCVRDELLAKRYSSLISAQRIARKLRAKGLETEILRQQTPPDAVWPSKRPEN